MREEVANLTIDNDPKGGHDVARHQPALHHRLNPVFHSDDARSSATAAAAMVSILGATVTNGSPWWVRLGIAAILAVAVRGTLGTVCDHVGEERAGVLVDRSIRALVFASVTVFLLFTLTDSMWGHGAGIVGLVAGSVLGYPAWWWFLAWWDATSPTSPEPF